jgi:hypothetical protein
MKSIHEIIEQHKLQLIKAAIKAYKVKYSTGRFGLVVPGLRSSTVGEKYVYLRTGRHLLAIYSPTTERFVALTKNRRKNHTK